MAIIIRNMQYKILHFINSNNIPHDVKAQMLELVRNVYDDNTAAQFIKELKNNLYEYIEVFDDTNLIALAGLMNSGLDFDIWEFAWAMVREDYRGKGVGKLLNDERIKIIKQYGGKKVLCVTQKTWHLTRNGFRIVHTFANGDNLMVCEI